MNIPLHNSIIRFDSSRKFLFNRAFGVYKNMLKSDDCKPTPETYVCLPHCLEYSTNRSICYVYLHAVKSLTKPMKLSGVIPGTFVLNMIIKAYARLLEVDEAIRVFREFGLYGCEPNAYSYCYIVKGLCEKERLEQSLGFYKEMKAKGLVPGGNTYMTLICSLAMERRFEDVIEAVLDIFA